MSTVTQRMKSFVHLYGLADTKSMGYANANPQERLSGQLNRIGALSLTAIAGFGLWILWNLMAMPVVIEVDGVIDTVYTHRRAVGALLSDVGLDLDSQDRLSHAWDARIEPGLRLLVERPRPFRIFVDGRDVWLSSWAETPAAVLSSANINFDPHDQVSVNGVPTAWDVPIPRIHDQQHHRPLQLQTSGVHAWAQMKREPLQIQVQRSLLFTVDDNNLSFPLRTTAQTLEEALLFAEITLNPKDQIQPSLDSPISTGLRVYIQRSTPISLQVDGRLTNHWTQSQMVGDALTEIGIGVTGLDTVSPTLDVPLSPNMQIKIVRVREEIEIEEEVIPFQKVRKEDPTLQIDTQQQRHPGAPGITQRRYRVRYEDGQEVDRALEDTWVAQEASPQVTVYGQKIIPRTYVNEAGQEIKYWRKIRMLATSYNLSTAGVSPNEPWYGYTYTGDPMQKGVVAVDPKIIPLRSRVYVPGYGYGEALDIGSAIRDLRIDLGYDDDNLKMWYSCVDVYLVWPPPEGYQIEWELFDKPPQCSKSKGDS